MERAHSTMPHGGRVIRHGDGSTAEYSLRLDSNPHFTATVLLCYARAVARLHELGGNADAEPCSTSRLPSCCRRIKAA